RPLRTARWMERVAEQDEAAVAATRGGGETGHTATVGVPAGDGFRAVRDRDAPGGDGLLCLAPRQVQALGDAAASGRALGGRPQARGRAARAVAEVDVAHSSRRRSWLTASARTSTTQTTAQATIAGEGPLAAKKGLVRATNSPSVALITKEGSRPYTTPCQS